MTPPDHPFSILPFRLAVRGRCYKDPLAKEIEDARGTGEGKAIELAVSTIEKAFGKGSIMRLGNEDALVKDVQAVSSGSVSLDIALGVGGFPRGRIIEIYGPESSGKTTLALHAIAEAQKKGGIAAFVDAEHALDVGYARKLGVRTDDLLISQPDSGEQALEIVETLVRSGAVDVLVIDSVAALVPKAELEGEMGDQHVGLQARLMSKELRKLTGVVRNSKTCFIFTNQLREKIGVMFGNPETTPGGRALKYHASVRSDLRRIGSIKEGETVVGNRVRAKVVKNKIAPPFRQTEFDIFFNRGICREGDLIDLGVNTGVIVKQGTWLSHGKLRLGQGRDRARAFLQENPDVVKSLTAEVNAAIGVCNTADAAALPRANGGSVSDEAELAEARAE